MKSKTLAFSLAVSAFSWTASAAQNPLLDLQKSHIEANAPDAADFDRILSRDLTTYFQSKYPGVTAAYVYLRTGPTQSGVAYPRYYLWVVAEGANVRVEGAARVSAIEKQRFEVGNFLSAAEINARPQAVGQVFPAALVADIAARAAKAPGPKLDTPEQPAGN